MSWPEHCVPELPDLELLPAEMNRRDKDKLITVAIRVAKLREDLREAEAERDELLASQRDTESLPPTLENSAPPVEPAQRAMTIADRIVGLLGQTPGGVLTASEVAGMLDLGNLQTVRSTLARLAARGQIENVDHGKYRAVVRSEGEGK